MYHVGVEGLGDATNVPAPSATPKPVLEGNKLTCPTGFYVVDPIGRTAYCLPNNISSQPVVPCAAGATTVYQPTSTGYARLCIAGETQAPPPGTTTTTLPPLPAPTKMPWLWLGLGVAGIAAVGGLAVAFVKK